MLTIFTIPKPFIEHINVIQRNALISWKQLKPECEIIILGDDEGVTETANELGMINIPLVNKNEYGTPLLNSAFELVQQKATNDILMYINTDIILFQDIIETIMNIDISSYIISGRRWNLDIKKEINFECNDWFTNLNIKMRREAIQHNLSGKDYFIFPKGKVNMLPFAVGRPGWDDWLLYHMRVQKIPIIDGTGSITVIHQNHDYSHSIFGKKTRVSGPEWEKNNSIIGSFSNIISLRDAERIIKGTKLARPPFLLRLFNILSYFYLWRITLAFKRRLFINLEILINSLKNVLEKNLRK